MIKILLVAAMIIAGLALIAYWFLTRLQRMNQSMAEQELDFERQTLSGLDSHKDSPTTSVSPPDASGSIEERNSGGFDAAMVERRLAAADLLDHGYSENIPIPGMQLAARLIRLKNAKTMVVVPEQAPPEWIESMLRLHECLITVGQNGQARILRRLEDFIAEQVFR